MTQALKGLQNQLSVQNNMTDKFRTTDSNIYSQGFHGLFWLFAWEIQSNASQTFFEGNSPLAPLPLMQGGHQSAKEGPGGQRPPLTIGAHSPNGCIGRQFYPIEYQTCVNFLLPLTIFYVCIELFNNQKLHRQKKKNKQTNVQRSLCP